MGGQAFSNHSPSIPTPRMSWEIYSQVLSRVISTLRQHYTLVDSPIEAPGKATFGDVDILVQGPLIKELDFSVTPRNEVAKHLAELLDAAAWIANKGNPTINLAVPWPSYKISEVSGAEQTEDLISLLAGKQSERFVQVDAHHLPTPECFRWELFHSAHGDMWNILGTTIRPFGLTPNDRGLYLRIPEIESLDRKKSMIFLTSIPKEVLDFLGLEEQKWWKPFNDQEEMFRFATTCRMFWVKGPGEGGAEGDAVGEAVVNSIGGQAGGEEGKKQLKHNDRQRMAKRPIFRAWVEDFVPKLRELGEHHLAKVTREQIRDQAFEKFDVREAYESRLKTWKIARHKDELWRDVIKGSVPACPTNPALRAAAIRILKAVLLDGEQFDGLRPLEAKTDAEGFHDLGAVKEFVEDNWRTAGKIGLEKQLIKSKESRRLKVERVKRADENDMNTEEKPDTKTLIE